jgi:hypothetical protein
MEAFQRLLWDLQTAAAYRLGAVPPFCGGLLSWPEEVPWGNGKRSLTKAYMLFLARWARRLSGAPAFVERNSRGVSHVLGEGFRCGRTRRDLGPAAPVIGADRCHWRR